MLITHLCLVATILNGEDIKITIITEISLVAQTLKRLPARAGDSGLIPGSGRPPGEGNDNPPQYSGKSHGQ